MKSITATLDNKYSHAQQFDKTYNVMDHIDSSRSVEYQAVGSNVYTSTSGARIVKFRLSDDRAWLDPTSVRIQYKITNKSGVGTENLYPIKSHGFFTRLRVMSRGSLIEDIGEYNRVHEMFQTLRPDNETKSDYLEGFKNYTSLSFSVGGDVLSKFTKIEPSKDMTVCFRPLSGLLNQGHYIPLSFLPIEVELELSSDPLTNIISKDSMILDQEKKPYISETWEISEFKILCEQKYYSPIYTDIFVNQITSENGSYKIPINHYTSIFQTLQNPGPIDINISKSVHSLDRVYVSFYRPALDTRTEVKFEQAVFLKQYNLFYSPASYEDSLNYNSSNDVKRLGLRIGSLQFPDMPLNSNSLCYYYLNKCHPETNIDLQEYHTDKFISVFNLERASADSNVLARGIDTNNKNLSLTVEFPQLVPDATPNAPPKPPSYIHVVMVNEMMVNIFNTHVDILE